MEVFRYTIYLYIYIRVGARGTTNPLPAPDSLSGSLADALGGPFPGLLVAPGNAELHKLRHRVLFLVVVVGLGARNEKKAMGNWAALRSPAKSLTFSGLNGKLPPNTKRLKG